MEYVTKVERYLDSLRQVAEIAEQAINDGKLVRDTYSVQNKIRGLLEREMNTGELVPEDVLTREDAIEQIRILQRQREVTGIRMKYDSYLFTPEVEDAMMELMPQELKNQKIRLSYQHLHSGEVIPPHVDVRRKSSLFFVLSDADMRTVWYKKTDDNLVVNPLFPIDIDKHAPVFETVMDSKVWYLIEQTELHSAHKLDDAITADRRTFCIEFSDLYHHESKKLFE
jgi:hypothetical protein